MGVDIDGSKNGGYAGGFFHLFDWKAKSRKKLFSSKSEIPEHTKQGKRSDGNLPTTRVYMMDEDEAAGMWTNTRGNSDYSCASSVTDEEEGFGSSKGANVVARLMGLDSMPGSSSSTQFLWDTQLIHNQKKRDVDFGDLTHRRSEPVRNEVELLKPQRIMNKFQSEMLPPKSAKTIPVTQHKLFSPIKCPGFVHSRNAADIMEAAAKMIESAPPPQSTKSKPPSSSLAPIEIPTKKGPSSLRLRDLRDKVETTQKTPKLQESSKRVSESESTAVKYLRGQSLSKSYNGGGGSSSFRASTDNNSGKFVSLAVQAKVNVQKRGGLSSSDRIGSFHQQEQSESKLKRHHKKKSPALNNSGVLRQNNQKQNCSVDKETLPSKSVIRKPLLDSSSTRAKSNRRSSGSGTKSGSRKLEVLDGDKEETQQSNSNMRNFPRKKRSISGGFQNKGEDDFVHKKKSVVQENWIEDSKKNGMEMDVVSFTFTAPLSQKNNSFDHHHQWGKGVMSETDTRKLSSLGYNGIGGDGLSKLLEQKLKELTYEASCNASVSVGSNSTAPSTFQEPRLHAKRGHDHLLENSKLGAHSHSDLFSRNPPFHRLRQQCQGSDDMEVDAKNSLDFHNPSPISVLEQQSFASESWISSESTESNWIEGKSTSQAAEVFRARKTQSSETDMDLSDSASSLSSGGTTTSNSTSWELEYVKEMLFSAESMYKDFTMGRRSTMIPPQLFQQLEDGNRFIQTDDAPLKRKLLFDCVSESMEKRFRRFVGGGSHVWGMGLERVRREDILAEEVYREIKGMVDCMVDDLVDKDMGSHCLAEFEAEGGFEVGVGIENEILSCLVDEAIAGILRL